MKKFDVNETENGTIWENVAEYAFGILHWLGNCTYLLSEPGFTGLPGFTG